MVRARRQRGSTLVEFIFVLPVVVGLVVGGLSILTASVRTVLAGQLAKELLLLADTGVDFGGPGGQQQIVEKGRELGLEKGQAAVYLTRVVREPAGFRVDRSYHMGDTSRWHSGIVRPEDAGAQLEPGEAAWVVEVFADSGAFTSFVPDTVKARNVL